VERRAPNPPLALPTTVGTEGIFLERLASGRFVLPHCTDCSRSHFPPRIVCPYCASTRIVLTDASGAGVVYSTTTVRHKPEQGGDHNVCLVDLAEGPRLMSSVIDCPLEKVRIGMKLRVDHAWLAKGQVFFRPDLKQLTDDVT